jgi:hypothetical protein
VSTIVCDTCKYSNLRPVDRYCGLGKVPIDNNCTSYIKGSKAPVSYSIPPWVVQCMRGDRVKLPGLTYLLKGVRTLPNTWDFVSGWYHLIITKDDPLSPALDVFINNGLCEGVSRFYWSSSLEKKHRLDIEYGSITKILFGTDDISHVGSLDAVLWWLDPTIDVTITTLFFEGLVRFDLLSNHKVWCHVSTTHVLPKHKATTTLYIRKSTLVKKTYTEVLGEYMSESQQFPNMSVDSIRQVINKWRPL